MNAAEKLMRTRAALRNVLGIMAYYHKDYTHKHDLDVCQNPDICGHCIAVKAANEVLDYKPKRMSYSERERSRELFYD